MTSSTTEVWVVAPAQMGMLFDPAATAENAYRLGRMGSISNRLSNQLYAFQSGLDVAAVVILDERTAYRFLQSLALEVDVHPVEASLSIDGLNVIATPGQMGRLLNVDKTLDAVSSQMQTFKDGEIKLAMDDRAPEILDVGQPAEAARRILATPLNIVLPNPQLGEPGPWQIDPGKTSILRHLFPKASFLSLDLPANAEAAQTAPEKLLDQHPEPVIIDEIQYAPSLLRHVKYRIDKDRSPWRYLLTGSQIFPLLQGVSESLAGRF